MKVGFFGKFMGYALEGACEACMPRTHEELLVDHHRRKAQERTHNQRHARLFVPR